MPRAFQIASPAGNLAAIYRRPPEGTPHVEDMLFLHGFGHELYNARPVMAYVWRKLAAQGVGVLSIDLPGCGDSAGDFGNATWPQWLSAVDSGHAWLAGQSGRRLNVCGLRLGAALALESAERVAWKRMLLLQPVVRGEEMLTQFLRLRVAFSGLRGVPAERETTQKLRELLAAGTGLEIAGYLLAPGLAQAIDGIDIASRAPPENCRVSWLETGTGAAPPAVTETIESWRKAGAGVQLSQLDVKPYWVHTRGDAVEYDALADSMIGVFEETPA